MASSLISPLLTGQFTPTGQNRFTSTSTSLSQNGILLDFSFTVPESYTGSWDFLKNFFLTVSYRIGIGNGSAIQLISSDPYLFVPRSAVYRPRRRTSRPHTKSASTPAELPPDPAARKSASPHRKEYRLQKTECRTSELRPLSAKNSQL